MTAALIPLFTIIVLGALAARSGYVPAATIAPLSTFVVRVALPALIFTAVTSAPLGESINPAFLGGFALGCLVMLLAGIAIGRLVFKLPINQAAAFALGMSNSNSGFMGYPIALSLIGPAAAPMLAQAMIVENVLIIPLAMTLIDSRGRGDKAAGAGRLAAIVVSALSNPVIIAVIAGLAVAASGVVLPAPLREAANMLSRVAAPVALFAVGTTVATAPMGGVAGMLAAVVIGKLVFHPLVMAGSMAIMPGIDPLTLGGGIIFAAVPMLSIYPLIAHRAGMHVLAASALLAATTLSFGSLWVVVHLIAPLISP